MAALFAVHSSLHRFAVFTLPTARALLAGLGAVVVGLAAGAVAPVDCPRHSAMKIFLVFPLAWMDALLAVHSSLHCFAVFCWAAVGTDASPSMTAEQIRTANRRSIVDLLHMTHFRMKVM